MVTRQICSIIDVQERDDFDELIHGLDRHSATTIMLDIAPEIDVLVTPSEFELLVETAALNNVSLEIATEDPVRQELGRIFGLRIATCPGRNPTAMFRAMETVPIARVCPAPSPADDLLPTQEFSQVATIGSGAAFVDNSRMSKFETDASFSFVVTPPGDSFSRPESKPRIQGRSRPRPKPVSRSLGWGSVVVSAFVVAAAIAILLIALLAPSADVLIVPETRVVGAEVTYGLGSTGAPFDVVMTPTSLTGTLTYQATVPATGEISVPDATARGMVFLTNPLSTEVLIPTGTVFSGPDGDISYLSVEPIDIPAADPFVSARFGTAVVEVEATAAGPTGNLEVGDLSGSLPSGVLYQNRFPIEGGTTKTAPVVTETDLESLGVAALQHFEAALPSSLDDQLPGGWVLTALPQLEGDPTLEFSAGAGARVESVSISAAASVQSGMYDPAALEERARDRIQELIAAQVPEGFGLKIDTLQSSVPRALTDAGSVAFIVSAEATAEARFDSEFHDALARDLVGKGEHHAVEVLESIPNVTEFSVSYGPSWLPWNPVPRFEERISVDVDGS